MYSQQQYNASPAYFCHIHRELFTLFTRCYGMSQKSREKCAIFYFFTGERTKNNNSSGDGNRKYWDKTMVSDKGYIFQYHNSKFFPLFVERPIGIVLCIKVFCLQQKILLLLYCLYFTFISSAEPKA